MQARGRPRNYGTVQCIIRSVLGSLMGSRRLHIVTCFFSGCHAVGLAGPSASDIPLTRPVESLKSAVSEHIRGHPGGSQHAAGVAVFKENTCAPCQKSIWYETKDKPPKPCSCVPLCHAYTTMKQKSPSPLLTLTAPILPCLSICMCAMSKRPFVVGLPW